MYCESLAAHTDHRVTLAAPKAATIQSTFRGAVVRRRQLAGDTPVEVLGLGLGLLVYNNVRRIGLLNRENVMKRT